MRIESRWALAVLAIACLAGLNSCATAKNPASSTTASMWVATAGDQMVRSYSINLTSGAVSQVGNAVVTGVQPQAMAITPDGKTLFIANSGDSSISGYSINSDGTLSAQGATPSSGQLPVALAIDPSGKFLFVANQGVITDNTSGTVSVFAIGSGSLTSQGSFPTELPSDTTGTGPSSLVVSPVTFPCSVLISGTLTNEACSVIYVANQFTNTVGAYEYYVDGSGNFNFVPGAIGGSPYPAGASPSGVALSRCAGVTTATAVCATADGNNLFVSNAGSNEISIFSACIQTSTTCATPDGILTPLSSGSPAAACCGPTTFMVDPAADFVYVLERGSAQVGQFRY